MVCLDKSRFSFLRDEQALFSQGVPSPRIGAGQYHSRHSPKHPFAGRLTWRDQKVLTSTSVCHPRQDLEEPEVGQPWRLPRSFLSCPSLLTGAVPSPVTRGSVSQPATEKGSRVKDMHHPTDPY